MTAIYKEIYHLKGVHLFYFYKLVTLLIFYLTYLTSSTSVYSCSFFKICLYSYSSA